MVIAARIIKVLIVLGLAFGGALLILTGSGVNLDELVQGSFGGGLIVGAGTLLESLVHALRLTKHELAVGVLMVALALLVAFYRA